jgi:tagaturonate reductase
MTSRPISPVSVANRVNALLERFIPLLSPAGVLLGIALPGVLVRLRPAIPLLFGAMTLAGALKLRGRDLGRTAASPLPLLLFFAIGHILMPAAVFLLSGLVFGNDPDTVSGYVLLYSAPTAVTAFIWASIYRGDMALSLALILMDTVLAPVVVPFTVKILLGASVSLDMAGMTVSLIFMIVVPTLAGVVLNEASRGRVPAVVGPWLTPFSKISMIAVIAANTAAVARQIRPDNPRLWLIIPVCVGFSVTGFAGSRLAAFAGRLGRAKATSLFFALGLRNTSAAMTLGIDFFPPAAALPAVLGIVFQQTTAAFMSRLMLGKIKGEPAAEHGSGPPSSS